MWVGFFSPLNFPECLLINRVQLLMNISRYRYLALTRILSQLRETCSYTLKLQHGGELHFNY